MPSIQPRGGRFQLRVVHKLLPKPFFWTFDDRQAADDYGARLTALLDRGIVPAELLPKPADGRDSTALVTVIERYVGAATPTTSEAALLETLQKGLKGVAIHQVTYAWVEAYVAKSKKGAALAPGSIRKRAGALARVATSNSPTCGHPKLPQARQLDFDDSGLMEMRAAASLRR